MSVLNFEEVIEILELVNKNAIIESAESVQLVRVIDWLGLQKAKIAELEKVIESKQEYIKTVELAAKQRKEKIAELTHGLVEYAEEFSKQEKKITELEEMNERNVQSYMKASADHWQIRTSVAHELELGVFDWRGEGEFSDILKRLRGAEE